MVSGIMRSKRWLLLFMVGMVSGCQSTPPVEAPLLPPPAERVLVSAEETAAYLAASAEALSTLKAAGTMTLLDSDGETLSAPAVVLFRAPDAFYLRAYKPLTPTLFSITSKGPRFWFFIPEDKVIYAGTHEALQRHPEYEVAISPESFLAALFPQPVREGRTFSFEQTAGAAVLSVFASDGAHAVLERKLWFDPAMRACVREEYYAPAGFVWYEIKRDTFFIHPPSTIPLAQELFIRNVQQNVALTISFSTVVVNEPVDDAAFTFTVPAGVDVEEIEE